MEVRHLPGKNEDDLDSVPTRRHGARVRGWKPGPTLLAAAFYLVVTLVIFAPVLAGFSRDCLAHPLSELNIKLWDQWRTSEGLLKEGGLPQEVPLINFPRGGVLFPSDPLNSALFLPVYAVAGLAARYNASLMVHLFLAALSAYWLALYLTGSRGGALVAGTAFGFNPFLLTYGVESGCSEAVCVAGLPLLLLFLVRSAREASLANPLLAALCCLFLAGSSTYHGQFGLLLLFVFLVYLAGFVRSTSHLSLEPLQEREAPVPLLAGPLLRRGLVFVLAAAALVLPLALTISRTVASSRSVLPHGEFDRRSRSADSVWTESCGVMLDEVCPGKAALRHHDTESRFVFATYTGFVVLGLALWSLRRRCPFLIFCAMSALLFLVLFAGPHLRVTRTLCLPGPTNVAYAAFFHGFPTFAAILEPFRLHVLFVLFVSLMAAVGLRHLEEGRRGGWSGLLVSLLVVAEYLVASPMPFPLTATALETPTMCRILRDDPRPYAIVDLPVRYRGSALFYKKVFYLQIAHGRAIPNRVAFVPRLMEDSPVYRALVERETRGAGAIQVENPLEGLADLARMGFGRILVHRTAYEPATADAVSEFLRGHLGPPVDLGDGVEGYDLPSPRR